MLLLRGREAGMTKELPLSNAGVNTGRGRPSVRAEVSLMSSLKLKPAAV